MCWDIADTEELFPVASSTTFFTDMHYILKVMSAGNVRSTCYHRLRFLEEVIVLWLSSSLFQKHYFSSLPFSLKLGSSIITSNKLHAEIPSSSAGQFRWGVSCPEKCSSSRFLQYPKSWYSYTSFCLHEPEASSPFHQIQIKERTWWGSALICQWGCSLYN